MSVTIAYDATHANIASLPRGQAMGYTTGSADIQWTDQDWKDHPGAVRICQDAGLTDDTADVADIERGAGTYLQAAEWYPKALASFVAGTRPGQRHPSVYLSASVVSLQVDEFLARGIKSGPGLIIADWNLTEGQAIQDVLNAAGPFPVVGIQWRNLGKIDADVLSPSWLAERSGDPKAKGPVRRITDGAMSLRAIADGRHEHLADLLLFSADHYTGADLDILGSQVPTTGVPYYTRN